MLPATIAQDIRQQVLHYLEATFNFRRHDEEDALRRFISDPESGLFKGPWLQVRRPFRQLPTKVSSSSTSLFRSCHSGTSGWHGSD